MIRNVLIMLLYSVREVWLFSQKEVAASVWQERCNKNSLALNDCNWCRCDSTRQYVCTARVCSRVDMFGHFNDAIVSMDVGMEGHGYWRSSNTACEPGVHYQKNELLCVCTEDGKWPNPVCRDVFQVLHSVIPTTFANPEKQLCSPLNLYQIGCNVCLCNSKGIIDPKSCTKRNCSNDISDTINYKSVSNKIVVDEVYADCKRAKAYQIGCKTCICLPNNRLLCDNCTLIGNKKEKKKLQKRKKKNNNLCSNKTPGEQFKKGCNLCYCDEKDVIYCTVLKCIDEENDKILRPAIKFESVDPPVDDSDCVPDTKYDRDCNECHCFKFKSIKYFACTMKNCARKKVISSLSSCVVGTKYEKNCLICNCVKEGKHVTEICTVNQKCKTEMKEPKTKVDETSLNSLHGYCEPLHYYYKDCNECKCLTSGKMVSCSSKICKSRKPLEVEFIPFIQKRNVCPKGHRYKVDCNFCQCMSNGNAICTTKICKPALKTT